MADHDQKIVNIEDSSAGPSEHGEGPLLVADWTHQEEVKAKRKSVDSQFPRSVPERKNADEFFFADWISSSCPS